MSGDRLEREREVRKGERGERGVVRGGRRRS